MDLSQSSEICLAQLDVSLLANGKLAWEMETGGQKV